MSDPRSGHLRLRAGAVAVDTFPLVPRRRLHGLELGPFRSVRRGSGSDLAGSRPYEPGDDVRSINWAASARLSAASGVDEFVVHERFAEQAPRIVLLSDRRFGMALHPPPWLAKPLVLEICERLIAESAFRARGLVGSLHHDGAEPIWRPPTASRRSWYEGRGLHTGFSAPAGSLTAGIERLLGARGLPAGTFVFVLSDFLDPVPQQTWLSAVGRGWDVVPVIVQDPTWEASFPVEMGGLVLPLADPATGRTSLVRLSRADALGRRATNEGRLAGVVARFAELGLDPVSLHDDDSDAILSTLLSWAADRLVPVRRAW